MKLISFKVTNFRSVNDSGTIDISDVTALLGRNESGKSNLLKGLHSLNPAEGFKALNQVRDFPHHRRMEECNTFTQVVTSQWELSEKEQSVLVGIFPRAKGVTRVSIGRRYGVTRFVGFEDLEEIPYNKEILKKNVIKIIPAVKAVAGKLDDPHKTDLANAADQFEKDIEFVDKKVEWGKKATAALSTLRQALAASDSDLTEKQERYVIELEDLADLLTNDGDKQQEARNWVIDNMPIFIYLDEYPDLNGHQNISEYLQRKSQPGQLTIADENFEKLCKVAGLDPAKLNELHGKGDQETRNQLANRASAVVTAEIKRLWKDRPLKIRFNLDAEHLDTFISDPNAVYDVEVNLDERSRGFKWFFSFYVTFAADTKGGHAEDAIILLDEPGLYLHAKSQSDLLAHLENDYENQIIYTTHSPFMVPTHNLDSIRTVNISSEDGTTVTNDPTGDSATLFPIQAALGYDLAQSLFVGPNNLIVEGVTDFWMLSSISEYLHEQGKISLHRDITLTPAGGAQKVSYMVALLTSENLNVLVLLDNEKDAQGTKNDLVKAKLIREQNVVFVTEAFEKDPPVEADIEDLLDEDVYLRLVKQSYEKELEGKELQLNENIPRIAKRVKAAFEDLGIDFHKTRPTRLLLNEMASGPEEIVTKNTIKRFEDMFAVINHRYEKHVTRDAGAFK